MVPVRNLRGVGRTKPIPVYTWIPPIFNPIYKIEIVTSTETVDVTDFVISGEYTDGVTSTIGYFTFTIDNSTQEYTDKFRIYDKINIYLDYGSTATTLKFVGLIERPSRAGENIILSGQSSAIRTTGKNITYQATDKSRSTILTEIINSNFSGVITTNNIEEDTTTTTVNYFEVPFWEIVTELCNNGGRDAYIDSTFDFHYFIDGSRENTTEAIVHEYNLIETGDFSPDLEQVSNRVRVYGNTDGNVPIIATSESESSQLSLDGDIKDIKINDNNIITVEQAKLRAEFELAVRKDPPTVGNIVSLGLPTISPGEKLKISDPLNGLSPSTYSIRKFRHIFSNDDPLKTEVTIQKERVSISNIMRDRIAFETKVTNNINPLDLDFSLIFDYAFNPSSPTESIGAQLFNSGTHENTELISNNSTGTGDIELISGQTIGTWTSKNIELDFTPSTLSLVANSNSENVVYSVSLDNGENFVELKAGNTFINATANLILRVNILEANTKIYKIGLLYNTV